MSLGVREEVRIRDRARPKYLFNLGGIANVLILSLISQSYLFSLSSGVEGQVQSYFHVFRCQGRSEGMGQGRVEICLTQVT